MDGLLWFFAGVLSILLMCAVFEIVLFVTDTRLIRLHLNRIEVIRDGRLGRG